VLLVVVIAIWGTIGFKIWSGLNESGTEQLAQHTIEAFHPKKTKQVETFSIQEVSRDPFLGTIAKPHKPRKTNPALKVEWLPITFNGNFKNNATGELVYVLKINNVEYLLKKGNKVEGVTLIKANSKSIVVRYKGAQKTIKLQE